MPIVVSPHGRTAALLCARQRPAAGDRPRYADVHAVFSDGERLRRK
jgi:hypothetical protein